jgi:hypothetical protein
LVIRRGRGWPPPHPPQRGQTKLVAAPHLPSTPPQTDITTLVRGADRAVWVRGKAGILQPHRTSTLRGMGPSAGSPSLGLPPRRQLSRTLLIAVQSGSPPPRRRRGEDSDRLPRLTSMHQLQHLSPALPVRVICARHIGGRYGVQKEGQHCNCCSRSSAGWRAPPRPPCYSSAQVKGATYSKEPFLVLWKSPNNRTVLKERSVLTEHPCSVNRKQHSDCIQ